MAFLPATGKIQCESFPKTASVAINVGDVLEITSGAVNPADSADTSLFGISLRKVASTDSDYASTTPISVVVLDANQTYFADVGTGSATAASVGVQYDLSSAGGIDVTATTHKVFTVTEFIDATHVKGRFNASYIFRNAS